MQSAIFILPFNPITRITTCSAPEWVHKTREQGNTVVAQVRGDDAVITAMKSDPAYCWLEDVEVKDAQI